MPIEVYVARIKICGITTLNDALAASNAGADALGLVFYSPSPRAIKIEQAKEICKKLPPFITKVGLFVNAEPKEVFEAINMLPLDLLQFHGEESSEYCEQFNKPWIKAIRVNTMTDIKKQVKDYHNAQGILLDTYVEGIQGGTGSQFDWSLIPSDLNKPIILAGGLTCDNITQAINQIRPYAVDTSGGVEIAKGVKDHNKIKIFIDKVRAAL